MRHKKVLMFYLQICRIVFRCIASDFLYSSLKKIHFHVRIIALISVLDLYRLMQTTAYSPPSIKSFHHVENSNKWFSQYRELNFNLYSWQVINKNMKIYMIWRILRFFTARLISTNMQLLVLSLHTIK